MIITKHLRSGSELRLEASGLAPKTEGKSEAGRRAVGITLGMMQEGRGKG